MKSPVIIFHLNTYDVNVHCKLLKTRIYPKLKENNMDSRGQRNKQIVVCPYYGTLFKKNKLLIHAAT